MLELFYFHEIRNDCSHSKAINKIFFFFLHLWNICLFFLSKVWANIETFMSTCNPPEGRRKIYIWCESTNSGSRHGIQHGHIIVKYVIIHEVFNPTKAHYWTEDPSALLCYIFWRQNWKAVQSIRLPACQSLSFESFVFVLLHHFGLRCLRLDVNWLLISWRQEDVRCDISWHVLLRVSSLHFLQLLHHLLLAHSGCCCQSEPSPVLRVCEEKNMM